MKQSIALLTLTFALNASAGCPAIVTTKMPEVPDGSAASQESMRNAKATVQTYVETIEDFLNCRGLMLSNARYNEWVDRARDAAASYNTELERYQQRNETLAKY